MTLDVEAKGIAADQTSLDFTVPDVGVVPPSQSVNLTGNVPSTFTTIAPRGFGCCRLPARLRRLLRLQWTRLDCLPVLRTAPSQSPVPIT